MSSLNTILSIGRSALSASQTALQVTGNNVSNVDTDGYSRQTLVLEDGIYASTVPGQLGSGVVAQEVVRSHDQFIEAQYLQKMSARDRFNSLYSSLSAVQNIFNEANTKSVNSALSTFFSDWGDLASADSDASRQTMLDDTNTLLSLFRSASSSMSQIENQTNTTIAQDVDTVNQLAKDIASINKQINEQEIEGQSIPNSLYDLRDTKIHSLASLMDVNVIDNGKGKVTVNTNAGQTIVDGETAFEFKFEQGKTVRQQSSTTITSGGSDVQAYYSGSDSKEYTLQVVNSGTVGAATFKVSLDGGDTWLTNDDGTLATFPADAATGKVTVGNLDIWFANVDDPSAAATGDLNTGDKFTLVPKKDLYWYTTAGTPVNATPQINPDGTQNTKRLTGGALGGAFEFRDHDLANYQDSLDAEVQTLVWEVNRIHSQGAGETPFSTVQGTYGVSSTTAHLSNAGLPFGSRITSGSFMLYAYDSKGNVVKDASGNPVMDHITVDPTSNSLQDIVDAINGDATLNPYMGADIVDGQLRITSTSGYGFQFGEDSSGILAALGVNTLLAGSTAEGVTVNETVTKDTDRVCVGRVGANGLVPAGDNSTATDIVNLANTPVKFSVFGRSDTNQTLSGYYDTFVGQVGSDTSSASYQLSYQTTLASQLEDQQQSVSGVNLDEELTNLIKFQHAYQAAAKLISTTDTLFETILGMKK